MSDNYKSLCSIFRACHIAPNQNILEEKGIMEMNISNVPYDASYMSFRLDPNRYDIFPFFETGKGLRRICDYIILVDFKDKLYILLVELKKSASEARQQLIATEHLMNYMISSAKRIQLPIDEQNIKLRKIRICYEKIKRNTRMHDVVYDKDKYIDYCWTNFRIVSLLK